MAGLYRAACTNDILFAHENNQLIGQTKLSCFGKVVMRFLMLETYRLFHTQETIFSEFSIEWFVIELSWGAFSCFLVLIKLHMNPRIGLVVVQFSWSWHGAVVLLPELILCLWAKATLRHVANALQKCSVLCFSLPLVSEYIYTRPSFKFRVECFSSN